MAQAATPGDRGLPCSPKEALALYQHLFRCPADLGQLRTALRQVQEGRVCLPGLELPTVLLEVERSRRAQEQLLWDLELLTGVRLSLFWPPRAQFHGLRDQAPCAWSQHRELCGQMGVGSRQLRSGGRWLGRPPRKKGAVVTGSSDGASSPAQPPAAEAPWAVSSRLRAKASSAVAGGWQAADGSSAPDPGGARGDAAPRRKSPGMSAEPTPGCFQGLDPAASSSFAEPGNSEFKHPVLTEERGQAEPMTQRPLLPSSGSRGGRTITQEARGGASLPESQDPAEGLGWSLRQDREELQKLLGIKIPQSQREENSQEEKEETPQGQGGEAPQGGYKEAPQSQSEKANQGQSAEVTQALGREVSGVLEWEAPQGENKDALQDPKGNRPECPRKETPQKREVKGPLSSEGSRLISQAWEVAQGEAGIQPREEGDSQGISGNFCKSPGEQISQPGRQDSPGPRGRDIQLTQEKTCGRTQETPLATGEQQAGPGSALAPLAPRGPLAQLQLPSPGAVMLMALSTGGSEQQERPTALSGHPELVSNLHGLQDPGGGPGPAEQQVGEAPGPRADGSVRFPGPLEERTDAAEGPKASKAAWPRPLGREKASVGVSAAQWETALQRLLELQVAARRRRWQDREQQRLRVLDRLRIARNRLCRVHPLGPPPSPAQRLPQDTAGQRRALRELLEQVHRERTGRLRALGARNTQNFQQLLCRPGAEEPAPGK